MDVSEREKMEAGFPFLIACRRRFKPDDPFFAAGNIERELLAKQIALDLTEDERCQLQKMELADGNIHCPIAGCGARLNCLEDFEDHYRARHAAVCSVCSRVYPTSRLLSIHISEMHDSFFQAKAARGFPMYECLVEGCEVKLKSYKSRQQHLVDKHKFPTSFDFYRKSRPSKHQRQKNQRRQQCARREYKKEYGKETDMDIDGKKRSGLLEEGGEKVKDQNQMNNMEVEGDLNELVSAVSKLSTSDSSIPSSISFGHRHARGLTFLPRSLRQQNAKQPSHSDVK